MSENDPVSHIVRSDGPDTSREAAELLDASGKRESQKRRILTVFLNPDNELGLIADEASHQTAIPWMEARKRVSELHNEGFIIDSGERRQTAWGRNAIVWVLSPAYARRQGRQ